MRRNHVDDERPGPNPIPQRRAPGGATLEDPCPGWVGSARPGWICEAGTLAFLAVNEAAVRHYGYRREQFLGMTLAQIDLSPEALSQVLPARSDAGERCAVRRHRLASGAIVDVQLCACLVRPMGRAAYVMFVTDVTAHEQARREALAVNDRLRLAATVFEHSTDAITITDRDNRIVSVNQAFTRVTGYEQAEVVGQNPRILSSGRQDRAFYREMWRSILDKGVWEGEIWNRRKSGECYPEWLKITAVRDADGHVTHHVAMFSDISRNKAAEAQIHRLAFYDALTGLPNRVLAQERMAAALAEAERSGRRVAVLFLDLDHFKAVNDSLGHHAGDRLLQEVARRLRASLRESDTVARLGGDEFIVLLPGIGQAIEVAPIVDAILRRLCEPLALESQVLRVTPSIGVTLFPDDARDHDTLLRNADSAMYEAKRNGRNAYRFFSAQSREGASQRWQLEQDMRRALMESEYRVYYQPQVDLASGALVGYEALLRWPHPERGMIPPDRFIGLAEETGLIVPLGEWVLREACRQSRAWQDAGAAALPMAVNVSARQFERPEFFDVVATVLAETGLAPHLLELELTERIVMDNAQSAIELLHRLRALGVRLAIDDFGTGYSSLGYLRRLPVDKLKIDRSFIQNIEHERRDLAIVQTIVTLARSLELTLVAEGVETAGQAGMLQAHGCGQAQGYYYGRPVAADRIEHAPAT